MLNKTKLREDMIAARKIFAKKEVASRVICKKIQELSVWKQAKNVCIYTSLPSEVDTSALFFSKKNFTWDNPDLYIVPGVAFDKEGGRLGRGKGFYDRLLEHSKKTTIGLAFEIQIVAKVPTTSYDVAMDMVVTERGIYGKTKTS